MELFFLLIEDKTLTLDETKLPVAAFWYLGHGFDSWKGTTDEVEALKNLKRKLLSASFSVSRSVNLSD